MKSKLRFPTRFSLCSYLTAAALIPSISSAGDYIWDGDTSGSWIVGTNWVGNPNGSGVPTHGVGSIQTFYNTGATNLSTFLGAGRNVGTLKFDANADSDVTIRLATTAAGTTIANLTMDVTSGNAAIDIDSGAAGNFLIGVTAGSMVLNDNLVITHNGTGSLTINRPISSGTGLTTSLTKDGTGTLTLTAANNFTGGLILNAGTLNINGLNSLGGTAALPSTVTINGGTIDNTSGAAITISTKLHAYAFNGDFSFKGTNALNLSTGTVNLGTASGTTRKITTTAGTITIEGVISDGTTANSLIKDGAGTLTLAGANAYTGTTAINNGTLNLGSGNDRLPTGTTVTLGDGTTNDNGILKLNSSNQQLAGLMMVGTGVGNRVVNGNATAATLTLNIGSTNNFTGILGGAGTNENNFALDKIGAGTLTLTGSNSYTGGTLVKAGSLVVGDGISGSLASTSVTVGGNNSSGIPTLGGRGTIAGPTTISSAGTGVVGIHAPGVAGANGGVGTQTFKNSLTYQSGSIFQWDLKTGTTGTAGTDFDAVTLDTASGSLIVDGSATTGSIFKVVLGEAFVGGNAFWSDPAQKSWNVFAATNGATLGSDIFSRFQLFDTSGSVNFSSYGSFSFTNSGSTGTLTWTAVPEPTSALAAILLGAGLLRRRRG